MVWCDEKWGFVVVWGGERVCVCMEGWVIGCMGVDGRLKRGGEMCVGKSE